MVPTAWISSNSDSGLQGCISISIHTQQDKDNKKMLENVSKVGAADILPVLACAVFMSETCHVQSGSRFLW